MMLADMLHVMPTKIVDVLRLLSLLAVLTKRCFSIVPPILLSKNAANFISAMKDKR